MRKVGCSVATRRSRCARRILIPADRSGPGCCLIRDANPGQAVVRVQPSAAVGAAHQIGEPVDGLVGPCRTPANLLTIGYPSSCEESCDHPANVLELGQRLGDQAETEHPVLQITRHLCNGQPLLRGGLRGLRYPSYIETAGQRSGYRQGLPHQGDVDFGAKRCTGC